ncbi:hypothetical protein [Streptomyces sp. BE133]|uniref:hypothetical protein n=1 Tax=Streptomyces sp. BE133 TaxID=3002523 RepID=UPI002E77A940|nr:hypothetical protein [Streptomyces sp. BE133]MEE1808144.1 hypothetical protein [Streptomyces sp. BE133]
MDIVPPGSHGPCYVALPVTAEAITSSLDPTGKGRTSRWKPALNAFDITFEGRLSAARQ